MIKIVIVDDHTLFREGLASIIQEEPTIKVIGLAGTVQEAVDVINELNPDIVLMDFSLPDGTGVDAARQVLHEHPYCKIIFLTMSDSEENLFEAIRCGARGFLAKNMRPSKLISSIKSVHQGESALSRTKTLLLMKEFSRIKDPEQLGDYFLEKLTDREIDVLRELTGGITNKEIADRLYISENTVKYHVHSILDKLSLSNRQAAAEFAKENGITL